ncbi:hypothetical protein Tco_1455624 [Tanacetum coccineum]
MKDNSSKNPYVIPDVKGNDTLAITCILIGAINVAGNRRLISKWTVGHDAAYGMPWKTLMKMMTKNYCQRSEINKMVPDESDKVEKYTGGLPNSIQGGVMASKPKMLQEAIELARSLMA